MMPVFAPQVGQMAHLGDTGPEEDATPVDSVVFLETETGPEKEVSMAAEIIRATAEAAATVTVKVESPFRVLA
jgi:hypothetical protein